MSRGAWFLLVALWGVSAFAAERVGRESLAERGYRLLTTRAYLEPDFDQQVFDELWQTWEEPLRTAAQHATPEQRRRMAFSRYGLTEAAGTDSTVALQYVPVADAGGDPAKLGWVMNCLACHGGKVAGQAIPGVPNSLYALQTLTEEVRATKLRLDKPLTHMDRGALLVPLGGSVGTTNAVVFGKLLLAYRDDKLNRISNRLPPTLIHHDMDAPAWWHMKRKQRLYIDGFAPKSPRALMQFLLIPQNGPEEFNGWQADYAAIMAWIESLEAPKYPWAIDAALAEQGRATFNRVCAECHGTYGPGSSYPERMVPIGTVATDRARFDALAGEGREHYSHSWFVKDATVDTITNPAGYVAPPLDGVWATAPYLHNGSVPTLWHMLNPDERPKVWHRSEDGYDQQHVGLEITTFDDLPATAASTAQARRYFDTRRYGKTAGGHRFADVLNDAQRRAVLEYLKTL
ncbi:MAG TPA: cytochrome c [Pirellulales bacterium]|jgi:mono/diheme cytochrome c family protein|nr:cytochrome c [Pirellulales bacterium]